ncbi:TrkH family potassium uptake protein [Longispora sp. NPDC051575]|uniref:TrkH family potassium uptake protein n=1 Tax=Longispora sp. NPDC051575 TaxID=3154943 RepID=UPI0034215EE3
MGAPHRPMPVVRQASRWQHPTRVVAGGFGVAVAVGTGLLMLPIATTTGESTDLVNAVFTATSAVCVTGLVTVDTAGHWSTFGEVVILALIQAGGLGIMTLATLFALLVSKRLGLRAQLLVQAETKALSLRDVRRVVGRIVVFSLACETVAALVLSVRFATGYDMPAGQAVYHGVFHAISAFNNAGFSLNPDNLMGYVTDPWINIVIAAAVIVGGLGFPVVFELARNWRRPHLWSVLTRVTVTATIALLVIGTVVFAAAESDNPRTLGPLGDPDKVMAAFFASVMARTAGFNSLDTAALTPESLLASDMLMFIGGGSAGTAGGIKVTTFALLGYVIWAEMRGHARVDIGRRAVPAGNQRQALAIALLGVGLVVASTFALLSMTTHSLDKVLFEAVSAFATVGLSTGITADLPPAGHLLITTLMFTGRIGPLTLASALALRSHGRRYELPEERTIVG